MKVHVKKHIQTAQHGRLKPGDVLEMDDKVAKLYLPRGAVEAYETKVIRANPSPAAGAAQPQSASPAAQVSPPMTASESGPGETRKKKAKRDVS